jgi:hypothetical protein
LTLRGSQLPTAHSPRHGEQRARSSTPALLHPRYRQPHSPRLARSRRIMNGPLWQIAVFALTCLATFVAFEICLDFFVAYLVTGRAY